jgi:hypothetical protein
VFAYQARPRVCFRDDGRELVFPNEVHIDIVFSPVTGLGGMAAPGRTGIVDQTVRLHINANTGQTTVGVATPLDEVMFDGVVGGVTVHLRGVHLEIDFDCQSRGELQGVLEVFHHVLPIALGVTFVDPPTVATTAGRVGDVPFTWQVERGAGSFDVTSSETQHVRVEEAMRRLELFVMPENRRLLAGISYFNRAVRLECSGATAFEFTGEVMLNLAKCLEVLFPAGDGLQGRDAVRSGLTALGYGTDEIETWFMPAMLLRAEVDVAHVRLTLFSYQQLKTIQDYAEQAEGSFRKMLRTLVAAVEDGSFAITPYDDEGPPRKVSEMLTRLQGNLASLTTPHPS